MLGIISVKKSMISYQHTGPPYKANMVSRPSYLYYGNHYSWRCGLFIQTGTSCIREITISPNEKLVRFVPGNRFLGTSCPESELSCVRNVLGTSWLGYELSWVRDVLGMICLGYELFRSPITNHISLIARYLRIYVIYACMEKFTTVSKLVHQ